MTKFVKIISLLLTFFLPWHCLQAHEAHSVGLKLIVGETDKTPTAGLVIEPQQGWRVYAPSPPGAESAGFPPQLDWSGSENLDKIEPVWPAPEKVEDEEGVSYVYLKETLVPLHVFPTDPDKPVHLKLKVRLLSCAVLCVPVERELEITIAPGNPENDSVEEAFEKIERDYEGANLWLILLIAVLGGFILNFMPCVLPVLSLKLVYFAKHKEQVSSSHFSMTALGILTSFLILALGAIALKASGELVGWGIHFQNPYFITFLLIVIILFAANMLGLFEFNLPSAFSDKATQVGEGSKLKDFFSGVFATLLATPCSAPFVGTSLSFALARNYSDILAVFLALGIGFASPYFIAMIIPSHRLPLPKPGKWMVILQRLLGIGLVATAVWLGYVLLAHVSLMVVFVVLGGTSIILAQLWWQRKITWLTVILTLLVSSSIAIVSRGEEGFTQLPRIKGDGTCMSLWCEFDGRAIPHLVAEGYTVVVDVTADWCVTCAVNKKLVFESSQITNLLSQPDIIAMRADWTKQNPKVTEFLQSNKRYGIPFNIVFGPKAPEGIPLPELLTTGLVSDAIARARGENQHLK